MIRRTKRNRSNQDSCRITSNRELTPIEQSRQRASAWHASSVLGHHDSGLVISVWPIALRAPASLARNAEVGSSSDRKTNSHSTAKSAWRFCPAAECGKQFEFEASEARVFEVPLALFERRYFYRSELQESADEPHRLAVTPKQVARLILSISRQKLLRIVGDRDSEQLGNFLPLVFGSSKRENCGISRAELSNDVFEV